MNTKVYLDLVRRPHGMGNGVPLPLQFPVMSGPVKNFFASQSQKHVYNLKRSFKKQYLSLLRELHFMHLHAFFFHLFIFNFAITVDNIILY